MEKTRALAKEYLIKEVVPTLETGDVIFCAMKSIIAQFMNLFQKDPVNWGHVLIADGFGNAYEAHWKVRKVTLESFFERARYWKIIRLKEPKLTNDNKVMMLALAPTVVGYWYGFKRLWQQFLDHIFSTDRFTCGNLDFTNQVCSSYVAWLYNVSNKYEFNGCKWPSCDPDDIEDDTLAYPERWETIDQYLPD